jgi:hypothetical protein
MTTTGVISHRGPAQRYCPECGGSNIRLGVHTARCGSCQFSAAIALFPTERPAPHARKPKAQIPDGPFRMAEPCRKREFRELHGDPFEHMNLAMLTRR